MDVVYDQELLDQVFHDLDTCLQPATTAEAVSTRRCVNCNEYELLYDGPGGSHPGAAVCSNCGVVQSSLVIWDTMCGADNTHYKSNYKRIHHWHERISQLLLLETRIDNREMLQIGRSLYAGKFYVLNKDFIRQVLRSLGLQLHIEKWLQIIYRLTDIAPPQPGPQLLGVLDQMFIDCLLYTSDAADE